MQVVRFTTDMLAEAGTITHKIWIDDIPAEFGDEFRRKVLTFLAGYYFYPDSPFNLACVENGRVKAVLLAHIPGEVQDNRAAELLLLENPGELFRDYVAYLEGNRKKEYAVLKDKEIILDLFISDMPGCGRMLMEEFSFRCRKAGIPSMVLWTDDTCDFSYYFHNGFEKVDQLPSSPSLWGRELTTYIFRKSFQNGCSEFRIEKKV